MGENVSEQKEMVQYLLMLVEKENEKEEGGLSEKCYSVTAGSTPSIIMDNTQERSLLH